MYDEHWQKELTNKDIFYLTEGNQLGVYFQLYNRGQIGIEKAEYGFIIQHGRFHKNLNCHFAT